MTTVTNDNPAAGFRESHVQVQGFRIRYLESGSGDPVVVLHGAGGLALSRAEALLADKFRVIAFEIPGFGGSTNDRSKSVADLAQTVDQAALALGLEKYNLIGYSFGAKLAASIAVQAPDHLEALVLVAPIVVQPPGGLRAPTSPEELEARLFVHPERRPPAPPPSAGVVRSQQDFLQRIQGLAPDDELAGRLAGVTTPTLVIFGTEDGVISSDMGRTYKERMPNCNLVFVYDAAHAVNVDRPEALAGVVADFLERHEVFVVSRNSTLINP